MDRPLLRRVQQFFREAPERVDMEIWLREKRPGHGLVGCIGGWGVFLKDQEKAELRIARGDFALVAYTLSASAFACNFEEAALLFTPRLWPTRFRSTLAEEQAGSPRYAALVIGSTGLTRLIGFWQPRKEK